MKEKKLFVYSCPNTMDGYLKKKYGHRYTDDVSICYAESLDQAIEIFSKLYTNILKGNVKEAEFNSYGICICTDY